MADFSIFDFNDYRDYLNKKLKTKHMGKGSRARLAEALSCQPSFVSQVLSGKSSLNLEQAYKVSGFLKLNSLEKEYLFCLVEMDRAGTKDLQDYFKVKLKELLEKSKLVENQMEFEQLSEAEVVEHYGNWNHVLIRNLVDIPKYNNINALKKKLNISEAEFNKALQFLIEKGLILVEEDGKVKQGHKRIHIKKESPLANYANITARLNVLKHYEKAGKNSVNYGSYMTLPQNKFEEFKKKFAALIVEMNSYIGEEEEAEMMAVFTLDFMEI